MERITEILEDKTEPKSRYRFIKLSNGEDIACEMETDSQSGYIMVKDPMKITLVMDRAGAATFGFSRWIPFSSQRFIAISKMGIVTITLLNEESTALYLSCRAAIEGMVPEFSTGNEPEPEANIEEQETQLSMPKSYIN